ncbi:MAG: FAD-dependent monooxygenase [Alphaproteobacteria bacterium]|nr:FAD-dependent monooxygenase [Alphaproteobacteria bacterium]
MSDRERIIVVGAGPTGLTCALWLARYGVPVVIIDKSPTIPADLRASTFHPPTLDMLNEFGITEQLLALGEKAPEWQIRVHETGEFVRFDLGILAGDTEHPYRLQCEQAKLNRVLHAELLKLDQAQVWFDADVVGVSQHDDGVRVTVVRGGERVELAGRYLIGADGAHSIVRPGVGIDFKGYMYPETLTLVVTPFDFRQHIAGLCNVNYTWRDGGNYSLLRVPGRWRVGSRLKEGESLEHILSEKIVQERLHEICPKSGPFEIEARGHYRVHRRIAERFRRGRTVLIGDAAHLNDPQGGMGMNSGIHDAINLAGKLRRVWHGESDSLLDRYERQRRTIAAEFVQAEAEKLRAVVRERDPASRNVRLKSLQEIARDPVKAKPFLLSTSMITSVRQAAAVA